MSGERRCVFSPVLTWSGSLLRSGVCCQEVSQAGGWLRSMDVREQHCARMPRRVIAEISIDAVHGVPLLILQWHASTLHHKAAVRPREEVARVHRQQPACPHGTSACAGIIPRAAFSQGIQLARAMQYTAGHYLEAWSSSMNKLTLSPV